MFSTLPKLVALGLLCCLCGCHSAKPITAASANRTPPSTSSKNSFDLATRDNSLVLLSDLLNDEKKLRLILLIKRETPELKRLVKGISNAASEGAKMLKARMKDDPAFKGAKPQLPPGEEATRKAIAKTKESLLLHTKGEEFEFQILLTQAEALGYGTHLALVAAANEPDAARAQQLSNLSAELELLSQQVLAMLRSKP